MKTAAKTKEFKSTHNLPFECAPWHTVEFTRFRIGTCHGLWACTPKTYDILAIANDCTGNGHFQDVLDWFYNSCKRDKRDLRILEVWNEDFRRHLIDKKGFVNIDKLNVVKYIKQYSLTPLPLPKKS